MADGSVGMVGRAGGWVGKSCRWESDIRGRMGIVWNVGVDGVCSADVQTSWGKAGKMHDVGCTGVFEGMNVHMYVCIGRVRRGRKWCFFFFF